MSLSYVYDGALPTGVTWSGVVEGSVTRSYSDDFRVTSLSVNGSSPTSLEYDLDGLPVRMGDLSLTRNAESGLITGTSLGTINDALSYDVFGALASHTSTQNSNAVYSATYVRDALGRIASKSETLGGIAHEFGFTYDLAGRLAEAREDGVPTATYSYDANGNRLSRTDGSGTASGSYDAQDRLIQFGPMTFVHNDNGERTSKTAAGQTTSYEYDSQGNLTRVTMPGGPSIEYVLDALERRVGRMLDGSLVEGLLYEDDLRPIAQLDGSNNVVSRFVYSTGINAPAYMIKAGITYRIIADHLGSPRLVIDAATGDIAQRLDYDEFGNVILDTNPGFQPFGFAGGLYDPQTGLVHYGARDYDPGVGRWLTRDPIGFSGGDGNLYAYVGNEPVNKTDPRGLCADTYQCTCLRQPAVCAEIAAAGGGGAGAGAAVGGSTVATGASAGAGGAGAAAVCEAEVSVVFGSAETVLEAALVDTVAAESAVVGAGLTTSQLAWITRMAGMLGLGADRILAYEMGDVAAIDRIAAAWRSLFDLAKWIR